MPPDPIDWRELNILRHEILAQRERGRASVEFSDRFPNELVVDHVNQIADTMAAVCQVRGLGLHWSRLPAEQAAEVLTMCLHEDLIYHNACMSRARAGALAVRVMGLFDSETIYLSNFRPEIDRHHAEQWPSLTDADRDGGLILVSRSLVGAVWVEDHE